MPAVRGMRLGKYLTDSGAEYKTNVDDDYFQNTHFGWAAGDPTKPWLPGRIKPRRVSGLSATSGRRSVARVPDVASDIWTGVTTTWTGQTNIGGTDTYTRVNKLNEKPSS